MIQPETQLEWIQGIGFIQDSLKLIDHHSLYNLAKEANIGDGPIIANVACHKAQFLPDGPNECLPEGKGNPALLERPINYCSGPFGC